MCLDEDNVRISDLSVLRIYKSKHAHDSARIAFFFEANPAVTPELQLNESVAHCDQCQLSLIRHA
jgi:hypothetical protein